MSGFFKSSIGRKIAMALSAFFLMFFLLQHLLINFLSVISPDMFNEVSYFMGNNPLVQYGLQPLLLFGIIYHLVMGFILEIQNKKAQGVKYAKNNGAANSSWVSRNMIYTGAIILLFMVFHFNDFWVPEIVEKYVEGKSQVGKDFYAHVVHMFENPIRVGVYCLAFVFLALHLLHGFTSAFQSMGSTAGRKKALQTFGKVYAIAVPLGYVVIALYHHFNH
ncbi:succinate dehydrogenase cytochrome b subunit [Pontimicrobium sp. IMCC45349]|uniref:succinate dehydrogenase cytochrome b subunit n=1 Tax=Pontimicrobium sp. IMCC45349 TaxID=3391574 RepID=UPI0039A1A65C